MSLFGAMFSGVSGLNAQSQSLGMISDNISNVNTVGYKATTAQFSTLVTRAATRTSFSPGGVQSNPIKNIDTQGLLQASTSSTDVAILGKGFFVINEAAVPGVGDEFFYTRAGAFAPDDTGALRNTAGFYLMGWPTDSAGKPTPANLTSLSSLKSINVSGITGTAVTTTTLSAGANLPASAANGTAENLNIQIFDSLGVAHNVTLTFTKQSSNVWRLAVGNPTQADTGVQSGTTSFNGGVNFNVIFNGDGTLAGFDRDNDSVVDAGTNGSTMPNILINSWTTGATNSTITPNLGTQNKADGMTQYASSFTTYFIDQNGVKFGTFSNVSIDEDGLVNALFDNGQTTPIFKIPLATFSNPNGLEVRTGNVFRESSLSGTVLLNEANTNAAGSLAPSSLESATVDLANEFTKMIITQRAYSANTRVISTANQMLDELTRAAR